MDQLRLDLIHLMGYSAPDQVIIIIMCMYHSYQLHIMLTVLLYCLYQFMMTLHFLNDVANDAEATQNQTLHHNR